MQASEAVFLRAVSYTHLDVYKRQMCGTIRRTLKSASKGTRLKFYKMMALPTLLYGSENWTLTKAQTSHIQPANMR